MLKKLIAGTMAAGMLLCGMSAFACDCGRTDNTTYEYYSNNDGTHDVWAVCHYQGCGAPYTHIGDEDCNFEIEFTAPDIAYAVCIDCGYSVLTDIE